MLCKYSWKLSYVAVKFISSNQFLEWYILLYFNSLTVALCPQSCSLKHTWDYTVSSWHVHYFWKLYMNMTRVSVSKEIASLWVVRHFTQDTVVWFPAVEACWVNYMKNVLQRISPFRGKHIFWVMHSVSCFICKHL